MWEDRRCCAERYYKFIIIEFKSFLDNKLMRASLQKLQPMQDLAFHKEQCEINGVQFLCHETYYEGELLNGVDLKIRQVRGLRNCPTLIDFLHDSQELVFAATTHLIVYNTNKRTYHQLLPLKGQPEILATHLQKMNNREYIVWIQREPTDPELLEGKGRNMGSRLKKGGRNTRDRGKKDSKKLLKSLFQSLAPQQSSFAEGNMVGKEGQTAEQLNRLNISLGERKVPFIEEKGYYLKAYDYSRKQMIVQQRISFAQSSSLKGIFMFWNHFKIVGYVLSNQEDDSRTIHYKQIQNNQHGRGTRGFEPEGKFQILRTIKKIQELQFNSQQNAYIFHDGISLNLLKVKQNIENQQTNLFNQFFSLEQTGSSSSKAETGKYLKLQIDQRVQFESQVLGITLNDQYLAVLTKDQLYFHSAYDTQSLNFTYGLDVSQGQPCHIQFNKNLLMLVYKNSSKISNFVVRSKSLTYTGSTTLDLSHCKEIMRIFTNSLSSQIFCVVLFYELESRVNSIVKSRKILQSCLQYVIKPAFIDVSASYLSPAASSQARILNLSQQKFKKVHTCPWLSAYLLQSQDSVEFRDWKESFDGKKCLALHPTGIFLVLCFKDIFKIYIITLQGLINTFRGDSAKDIQACAISPSGNHIAIGCANSIILYDFYSCTRLRTVSLSLGPIVQSLQFQGYYLSCVLKSKKIYIYDILNQYKELLALNPRNFITESNQDSGLLGGLLAYSVSQVAGLSALGIVHYDPILHFIIFSHRSTIYFYNCTTNTIAASFQFQPITAIHYCQNLSTIFFGTERGEVICFSWPNKPSNLLGEQRKFKFHGARVLDLKVSSDLRELISVGQDQSVVLCSLAVVQNMKRLEGLQIVEQLSGSVKVCFDILPRRGCYQYSHGKFGEKMDVLKDFQDEVLNLNFIMPEERMKQKQHMLSNITQNSKDMADLNAHEYSQITKVTNQTRDLVAKLREELYQFQTHKHKEKQKIKQALFAEYIKCYNHTQNSEQQLRMLKEQTSNFIINEGKKYAAELERQKLNYELEYSELILQYESQSTIWQHDRKEQLTEIDEEKKIFISQNVQSLGDMINEIHNNNGIIACRNNNLEKEISELKRKMEEYGYLLHRLKNNTIQLQGEQIKYQKIKQENGKLVQREDKVNLAEIEKRYVKQTQLLIQKDKEIQVKIVNYQKEKGILVHLEKCLEEVEQSIERLVANILTQKKEGSQENNNIAQFIAHCQTKIILSQNKKKQKISSRNQLKNYLYRLQAVLEEVVGAGSKTKVAQLCKQGGLLQQSAFKLQTSKSQEQIMLDKIMNAKLLTLKNDGRSIPRVDRTADQRRIRTEGRQQYRNRNSPTGLLGSTSRQMLQKRSKKVFVQLAGQYKQYQRIKTEQVVFQNTRRKFNLQNQDLIENYNSLAMENRRIVTSLKKQELMNKMPMRQKSLKKTESNLTPFQLYIHNKSSTQRNPTLAIPTSVYQY